MVAGFPSPTTAGVAGTFTVTAEDAYGNTTPAYAGTVKFTSSDAQAVLPSIATLVNGVGSFGATPRTAGAQSLTATDTSNPAITGSQAGITVKPAAASELSVSAPSVATAGTAFSVTVTALDPYGNTAIGYRGTVHFTSSDCAGRPAGQLHLHVGGRWRAHLDQRRDLGDHRRPDGDGHGQSDRLDHGWRQRDGGCRRGGDALRRGGHRHGRRGG